MTEQTEGAEALAHWILANVPDWLNPVDAHEFAVEILTSHWLRDREAAAEVRGAQAVLAAVAHDCHDEARWCEEQEMRGKPQNAVDRILVLEKVYRERARAAAAAAGGGGEA